MDSKKHEKADALVKEIKDAEKRISTFDMMKNHNKGYPESRTLIIKALGFEISLPGKYMKQFSDRIGEILSDELKEFKKEYKEL